VSDTNTHAGLKTATQKHYYGTQSSITRIKLAETIGMEMQIQPYTLGLDLGPQNGKTLVR
jgi:hypothetical protein